ncbi:MAG: YceI family protein [Dehalococcoidia bacterium]|nr:MAG: YceI family protein [Dehalococcoidia bacterium]
MSPTMLAGHRRRGPCTSRARQRLSWLRRIRTSFTHPPAAFDDTAKANDHLGATVRRTLIISGSAAVVVTSIVALGAWSLLHAGEPAPASLANALRDATPDGPRPIALSPAVQIPELSQVAPAGVAPADLTGRYRVVAGPSFVGYRVKETLAGLGSNVAVGRSREVTASFAFDGRMVAGLEVSVDMRALKSDDTRRDGQLRTQAIEADRFPSARFAIPTPFNIGAAPAEGEELHLVLVGDLTLHGVTRPVTAHLYGARKGELAVVSGFTEVLFSDFGIKPPQSIVVASVDDLAIVEFQLIFKKA